MKYSEIIQSRYNDYRSFDDESCKYDFIEGIFNFTTYDGGDGSEQEYLCNSMIDVLKSIVNGNTFEYQKESEVNYRTYIIMVNMPFLKDKIEWGTSIRGAWLDESSFVEKHYCINFDIGENLDIPRDDIVEFIKDLIEWFEK